MRQNRRERRPISGLRDRLLAILHRGSGKPRAIAFVDYEYWYFSYQNLFRMEPDVKGWRKELDEDYDILDIMVFAEFSSNQRLQNQITPLRNITNTIIETHQQTRTRKKDMTDFIMLDYIYQTAASRKDVDVFIIFTGDGHFHSVVKYLTQTLRKKVAIYGIKESFSAQLQEVASVVKLLPYEDSSFRRYAQLIVEDLAITSKNDKIIPTFNSTVSAVMRKHQDISEEYVRRTLQKMLDDGLVVQRMQRVDFNRKVKILRAEWAKLNEIGLWDYENG